MDKFPLISIITGIYNCGETLPEAIGSILNQTYTNWELILCDDASTDDTLSTAENFQRKYPEKIKIIKNAYNCGLNHTLNNCLAVARGEYIARMDGDDICNPERLEKELDFLKTHPEFDIVSTNMEYFDNLGVFGTSQMKEFPQKEDLVKGTPFCHAPCMVRKRAYDAVGGYTEQRSLLRIEDYDLWIKMYQKGYKGYNIQEALYSMRDDRNAVKRRKFRYRVNEAYVKLKAVRLLKLPIWNLIYVLRPLIIGLMPEKLYVMLHKKNMQ